MRAHRRSLGKPDGLVNVLVTASVTVDPGFRCFAGRAKTDCIVATVVDAPADRRARLAEVAEVWTVGSGRVDLRELLTRLKARGVERLLVEGGGETNWGFVRDDLFDELYVTIAPALLGGRDAPTLCEGDGLTMAAQRRLRLLKADVKDGEIFCHYAVLR